MKRLSGHVLRFILLVNLLSFSVSLEGFTTILRKLIFRETIADVVFLFFYFGNDKITSLRSAVRHSLRKVCLTAILNKVHK